MEKKDWHKGKEGRTQRKRRTGTREKKDGHKGKEGRTQCQWALTKAHARAPTLAHTHMRAPPSRHTTTLSLKHTVTLRLGRPGDCGPPGADFGPARAACPPHVPPSHVAPSGLFAPVGPPHARLSPRPSAVRVSDPSAPTAASTSIAAAATASKPAAAGGIRGAAAGPAPASIRSESGGKPAGPPPPGAARGDASRGERRRGADCDDAAAAAAAAASEPAGADGPAARPAGPGLAALVSRRAVMMGAEAWAEDEAEREEGSGLGGLRIHRIGDGSAARHCEFEESVSQDIERGERGVWR
jgi:hypothetical protein